MKHTDWTAYYNRPYKTASFTRKITGRILVRTIQKYLKKSDRTIFTELGGANSAFLELFLSEINPAKYVIVDSNRTGLEKTKQRIPAEANVQLVEKDILNGHMELPASDLVLSVGLIEHFDKDGTCNAIRAHFDLLKKDGVAVITFPTPTFLYRIARFISEISGLWIFHDERPLTIDEVMDTAQNYGQLMEYRVIWPIVFTQGLVVLKKR